MNVCARPSQHTCSITKHFYIGIKSPHFAILKKAKNLFFEQYCEINVFLINNYPKACRSPFCIQMWDWTRKDYIVEVLGASKPLSLADWSSLLLTNKHFHSSLRQVMMWILFSFPNRVSPGRWDGKGRRMLHSRDVDNRPSHNFYK